MSDHEQSGSPRFDVLSTSDSGLTYVREKRGGVMRVLTESELQDFSDPPPCTRCGEQFGCDHFNCAGEPLLAEDEIESAVPPRWLPFAKDHGLSRQDLVRLETIEEHDGEYRVADRNAADMRALELALLLNESR